MVLLVCAFFFCNVCLNSLFIFLGSSRVFYVFFAGVLRFVSCFFLGLWGEALFFKIVLLKLIYLLLNFLRYMSCLFVFVFTCVLCFTEGFVLFMF